MPGREPLCFRHRSIFGGKLTMRRMRAGSSLATAVAVVATVLGVAAPASASYSQEPISLPWSPAGPVYSSISRGGVLYVGGALDGTGGIAALDASTGSLLWQLATDDSVRALALSADGRVLFAGGSFATIGGQTRSRLAAIELADHSLVAGWAGSSDGQVRDLAVRGNTLYLGGRIGAVDGAAAQGLAAVDATTGRRRAGFTVRANDAVFGLARSGHRLIVSGKFTRVDGKHRASLAAINLRRKRLTAWAPPRLCPTCSQYWDVKTDGTNAYVATSGNAAGAYNLTSGSQVWPRIRADGDIQALALPGDGRLYFGGHFGQHVWSLADPENDVPATLVASVVLATGRIDAGWTPKLYQSYPGVWTLTPTSSALWVGGAFGGEQVNGSNNKRPFLAAYPVS